jgi:DNA-binding SARP family transcriptional activator
MGTLHITLFGRISLWRGEEPALSDLPKSVHALLAYLLIYRHNSHPREMLLDLFWGDSPLEQARSCLSTALWRLRQRLEPPGIPRGSYLVTTPTGEICFNPECNYWLDVATFEDTLTQGLAQPVSTATPEHIETIQAALELYNGELLQDCYMDWILQARERMRLLYLNSLAYLMHYYREQEAFEESINYARQILWHDPLQEQIHRELMRLYAASSQRALAIRQYQLCQEVLAKELDIPPMDETQLLYEQIRLDSAEANAEPATANPDLLHKALRDLEVAQQQLADTSKRLQEIQRLIRNLDQDQV